MFMAHLLKCSSISRWGFWVKQQPIPAVGFCGFQAKSTKKKNRDYPEEESTCARVTMIVATAKNEEDEGKPFQSEGTTNEVKTNRIFFWLVDRVLSRIMCFASSQILDEHLSCPGGFYCRMSHFGMRVATHLLGYIFTHCFDFLLILLFEVHFSSKLRFWVFSKHFACFPLLLKLCDQS